MNLKLLCVYFLGGFLILYFLTISIVQVDYGNYITNAVGDSCGLLRNTDTPTFAVAERKVENAFSHYIRRITLSHCNYMIMFGSKWNIKYRPIVGDHIHIGIAISLFGHEMILRDRNMTEPIPYEHYRPIDACESPPKYAYVKKWYHNGVHTHCDSILHIHPWSAPKKLRVEGKEVTLKMWFESVGIEVGSILNTLKMPGNQNYNNWTLEYFVNVTDDKPSFITTDVNEMSNLWLVDHHAFIKLYLGDVPNKNLRVLKYPSVSKIAGDYPSRYMLYN